MPADRQVHLRVIGEEDVIETRVAVEPMSAMHYVTISGLHSSYRVEIGYFQPLDTWHCVATSGEVEMPPQGSVELGGEELRPFRFTSVSNSSLTCSERLTILRWRGWFRNFKSGC